MATRGGFLVGDRNIVRPRHPVRYVASKQTKSTKRKKKKPEWDVSTRKLAKTVGILAVMKGQFIYFMKLTEAHNYLPLRLLLLFFQSTVNDLNVHKATKEEQVVFETFITANKLGTLINFGDTVHELC